MAKGIGFLGNMRGKIGNMVAYSLKNSNNKETQGFRVYQPNVANPQSDAQMLQRIKMTAVNNMYRALKPIIDRGFEGVEYGNKSRQQFMSYAMGREFNGPYLFKGSIDAVPLDGIPISSGSIPAVSVLGTTTNGLYSSLLYTTEYDHGTATISALSATLLADNPTLQDHDQITFIAFVQQGIGRVSMYAIYESIELDTTSSTPVTEVMSKFVLSRFYDINVPAAIDGLLGFGVQGLPTASVVVGGAVIISRAGSNDTHLRSIAVPYIDERVFTNFYNLNQLQLVVSSYRKTENAENTDWPTEATRGSSIITLPFNVKDGAGKTKTITDIRPYNYPYGPAEGETLYMPCLMTYSDGSIDDIITYGGTQVWKRDGLTLTKTAFSEGTASDYVIVRPGSNINETLYNYLLQSGYTFSE